MKILLAACNAKYIHSNPAVYALRAYAGKYREQILIREYTINQEKDDVLRDLYESGADVICFSCYIWNISYIRALLEDLPKILPGAAFWAGGPEVSFDPEQVLKAVPCMKGIMVGEGEETFLELADLYLGEKGTLAGIKGIVYREKDRIIRTERRNPVELSSLPFAYEDLSDFKNRIIYYESSRGCPFSCSYCLSSVEKALRFRSLDLVKKELQFFIDRQVPQVKFVDRTFNCRHSHAMEIWRYITEHDRGVTNFHFEISADLLNEEELALMEKMRPGLIQLEIGVQSVNPRTLQAISRKADFEKIKTSVKRIHSYGNIHQHLDLIAGLPYEDYESFRDSFNQVYALKPHQLQLGFLKVLKGSRMMECTEKYGILYKSSEPYEVLGTSWLSYKEILKLKTVESMVEVYYNSGQFQYTLAYLERFFSDAFGFFEALGRFYKEKGYLTLSHSRLRRYEILLEFLTGYRELSLDKVKDCMVYDLYLRENLKSRPSFALCQREYEKEIWTYRKEKKIPKTAHIEVFRDGRAVLFDYTKRNPLTNNGKTEEVNLYGNV